MYNIYSADFPALNNCKEISLQKRPKKLLFAQNNSKIRSYLFNHGMRSDFPIRINEAAYNSTVTSLS